MHNTAGGGFPLRQNRNTNSLLYPTVSDYWNSVHQSRMIADYAGQVADLNDDTYESLLAEAKAYNEQLIGESDRFKLTEEELEEYGNYLKVSDTDVIGYIEIEKIDCYLPIYYGTDDAVLQVGAGHMEGSSLPVGGESTHAIISGHRGCLPPSCSRIWISSKREIPSSAIY